MAYIAVILHQLECSVFHAMIKLGDPIIALVDPYATCCLVRLLGHVDFHRLLKCCSSHNYVDVVGGFTGGCNWVGPLDSQCLTAKGEFINAFSRQRGAAKHQARGKNTTGLHISLCCARPISTAGREKEEPGDGILRRGVLALFMRLFHCSLACCLLGRNSKDFMAHKVSRPGMCTPPSASQIWAIPYHITSLTNG